MVSDLLSTYFEKIKKLKIAVIGDFALDFYYHVNKNTNEISVETGKEVYHGEKILTHLGGAGNIVKNLVTLGVSKVYPVGIIGDDIFGREIQHLFKQSNVITDFIISQNINWHTITYTKPYWKKKEENRIDFGVNNKYDIQLIDRVIDDLKKILPDIDAVIVNQQYINPLIHENNIKRINDLISEFPDVLFLGDLRDYGHNFRGGYLKVNTKEAARFLGMGYGNENDLEYCLKMAIEINKKINGNVLLTRGANGLLYYDGKNSYSKNGIYVDGPIDTVGAGDSCLSAFAVGLAADMPIEDALEFANIASAVTIKKIQQTGTATPKEIMEQNENNYLVYNLGLATDNRKAQYLENTDIEIVSEIPDNIHITHAIFDHDGTISTLREGWEQVMHPMMMESICGDKLDSVSYDEYQELSQQVKKYIDQSTGLQTIVQMMGLVQMIKNFGMVPEDEIKSAAHYKAIYLQKLMVNVNRRIAKINKKELTTDDFILKEARGFLEKLQDLGTKLYLVSGTDEEDVVHEAEILGYAGYFKDRIYGSKGNEIRDAKKIVIEKILKEVNVAANDILVIGDGPVEMREGRKAGAYCIGIASDEVRRYGLNNTKRSRLIKAGAHIIISDYTQMSYLFSYLFKSSLFV